MNMQGGSTRTAETSRERRELDRLSDIQNESAVNSTAVEEAKRNRAETAREKREREVVNNEESTSLIDSLQNSLAKNRQQGSTIENSKLLSDNILQLVEGLVDKNVGGESQIANRVAAAKEKGQRAVDSVVNQLAGAAGSRLNTGVQAAAMQAQNDLTVQLAGLSEGLQSQELMDLLGVLKGATVQAEGQQAQESVQEAQQKIAQQNVTSVEAVTKEISDTLSQLSSEEVTELSKVLSELTKERERGTIYESARAKDIGFGRVGDFSAGGSLGG